MNPLWLVLPAALLLVVVAIRGTRRQRLANPRILLLQG
jgi:hypothetical protein